MLERLSVANKEKVVIVKVDANKNREWASREKLKGVPTMQFYKGGQKLTQFAGAYPEADLQEKIDKYAAVSVDPNAADGSAGTPAEPVMKPMSKDWLPPGVTRE